MRGIKLKGYRGSLREPIITRTTESGCLECIARAIGKGGHVRMRIGKRSSFMHRFIYEQKIGPIPPGMCVCHRCDNPACINPDHLFLTTNRGNTADRHAKHRDAVGSRVGTSVLTESQVAEIKRSREMGTALARRFGVSKSTISAIRTGKHWTHVEVMA